MWEIFNDIETFDWPAVKAGLIKDAYADDEPVPVAVKDLSDLTSRKPQGVVLTKLHWEKLAAEDFERLLFVLISDVLGYENPEWLMQTNAPDRGRDLSVSRVIVDPLSGTTRKRVLIQCKHWLNRSISVDEIARLRELVRLWEPPRIDAVVIASSGRFTADAIAAIERHNLSDTAMTIEMWPDSHLERLLAARPAIVAQFHLR